MINAVSRCVRLLLAALVGNLACASGNAAVEVRAVQYQQDNPYPEFNCYFHYGNYPNCNNSPIGCNAMVFLKNTGASSVTVESVSLAGYNLDTIIKRTGLQNSGSIYYWQDPPPQDVFDAGEPIWYRADPNPIPAGGFARVVVRLRSVPVTQPISIAVNTSAGTVTTNIAVNASTPLLASVSFSTNRMKVYLHWRRNGAAAAPASVWLDGTNVTSLTSTVSDPTMNFAVSVIQLSTPLANMSYHMFQGVYADGKTATGSLRVWVNRFLYGTWGVREIPDNNDAAAQAWINECQNRGVNSYVYNSSGGLQDYLGTAAGQNYAEAHDYGYVKDGNQWGTNPRMWLIEDEPDIEEAGIACGGGKIPCSKLAGTRGMYMVDTGEAMRALNPAAPTSINLDGNFKPDGWYIYGQLADVMMMDSYYESEQAGAYWNRPYAVPVFRKATSIYAAALATTTAAEPNPMHMVLFSNQIKNQTEGDWPYPSPIGKRIQAYYALAGGAKGMAYWWFKIPEGLGTDTPAAVALWKEIGMIGNEIKTAQPLLVISHPVTMPVSPSVNVWARTLAADTNTLVLFAVNDNYLNDEAGTHLTNVPNAWVTNTLPTWMQGGGLTAFEITAGGLKPISTQLNGNQLQVSLGTLVVSRMIVLTRDLRLLSTLQQRYETMCRPGVCALDSASCTNIPLNVAQHPANLVLTPGGSGTFAVAAFGTGLKYRWQKNLSNLSDGGHYSGCTNSVLTVTGADANDEDSYRCVVFTTYGTNNSNPATLTLTTDPPDVPVANPATQATTNSFNANWNSANGATSYRLDVSTNGGFANFVSGYQDLDVGNTLSWGVNGLTVGTYYYRVRASNGNGTSGNSGTISVTLIAPAVCPPTSLSNASFEGGNTGGVANGWTGYQRAPNPTTIWSIQTASPPSGAGTNYQQIANSSSTGSAGVRQNITGCVIGATYTISGWMRGNSGTTSTCKVKVSPTASTDWATANDLSPAQTYIGSTWVTFSGTVVATGTNMTLWLDGQTTGSGNFNAECFDAITVGCELTSVPPSIAQQPVNQNVSAGGNASFTIQAVGSDPLTYRWQKNSTNLNNGGHYSGVLTPTLAISSADNNDVANYRCVVTNAFGSTNSIAASLTVTNATTPPIITQQPTNQSRIAGGTVNFTVLATGSGTLYYQWQKNNGNLSNGGHYSGSTTPTLTITGVDTNDAANYRCVVTNNFGSTNSIAASLTVTQASFGCFSILNADFESGFGLAGGGTIATNWTEWEVLPGVVTGYEEPTIVHGGARSQRIRISGTNTSGGVYQRIPVTSGALYSVSVWIYADTALTSCYLGVDPAGGINAPNGAVTWSTATTNVAWVQKSWIGNATANYITVFLKVATPDNVKRNGYFDDAAPSGAGGSLQLAAQYNGSALTLTWPGCPNARLERTASVTAPSWATATNQVSVVGGQKSVILTPTGSAGYFRLMLE